MLKELRTVFVAQVTLLVVAAIFVLDQRETNAGLRSAEKFLIYKTLLSARENVKQLPLRYQVHEGGENFETDFINNYEDAKNDPEVLRLINFTSDGNTFWSLAQSAPLSNGRRLYFRNERPRVFHEVVENLTQQFECDPDTIEAKMTSIKVLSDNIIGKEMEVLFSDREPVWTPKLLGYCWGNNQKLTIFLPDIDGNYAAISNPEVFEEKLQSIGLKYGLQSFSGDQVYNHLRAAVEEARIKVPILGVNMSYPFALVALMVLILWGKISAISMLSDISRAVKGGAEIEGRFLPLQFWWHHDENYSTSYKAIVFLASVTALLIFFVGDLMILVGFLLTNSLMYGQPNELVIFLGVTAVSIYLSVVGVGRLRIALFL